MSTNITSKMSADAAINDSDDSSMNMTGALITMMGKFLSTLNQSSMIQNTMLCTERSLNLDMIANQSEMQVEEGQANATASMVTGIAGIVGGVAAIGGGIAGVVGSVGQFAELSSLSEEGDSVVIMNQVSKPLDPMAEQESEPLDPMAKEEAPGESIEMQEMSRPGPADLEDDEPVDDDITTQPEKSEMDKKLEQDQIKARWERLSNLHHIGQGFNGLSTGLGQVTASTYTTQAALNQAAATKLGGLAQSVNSMMSATESNYQSTLSLNTQLANEFQQFTAWWLSSSKA